MRVLRQDLPFPGILGRVCPRPCEGPCRRQLVEDPITICQLHRFMADQTRAGRADRRAAAAGRAQAATPARRSPSWAAGPPASPPPSTPVSRATPSRSSRRMPKPGGMLRYGIPSYRLPRDVLDDELNILWRMGVELQTGVRLGVDFQLEDLTAEYDVVFLALGAFNANAMGCPARTPPASSPPSTSSATRARRHGAGRQEGHRHRRRLHRHGRLPHRRAPRRRRGHLPLPALAQGDARPPHRGRRGRGGGRAPGPAGGAGARAHRRRRQRARHRDDPHGAR